METEPGQPQVICEPELFAPVRGGNLGPFIEYGEIANTPEGAWENAMSANTKVGGRWGEAYPVIYYVQVALQVVKQVEVPKLLDLTKKGSTG